MGNVKFIVIVVGDLYDTCQTLNALIAISVYNARCVYCTFSTFVQSLVDHPL